VSLFLFGYAKLQDYVFSLIYNKMLLLKGWCQFHQHFTRTFFADFLALKNCKAKGN